MRVTVFGATGYAGGAVTRELLDRGHQVTGVARTAPQPGEDDRVPPLDGPGQPLSSLVGSIHDPDVVRAALEGADAVFVALPFREVDGRRLLDALPSLVEACIAAGARLGMIGGAGSLRVAEDGPRLVDTPEFPDEFKGEALAAAEALDALRETDDRLDWFYLSPAAGFGSYAPGPRTGSYRLGGDVLLTDPEGGSHISAPDLAIAVADELETPRHHRARFTVAT